MENVRVGQNENIDDDTRERARKFVESGSKRVFADPDRFSGPAAKTPIGSAGSGGSKYAKGGSVSASRRGDGIAQRGKTKGRMC